MQLYTETASRKPLKIFNINAQFNFAGLLQKTYALSKRIAHPIAEIHPRVCVGTWRLVFSTQWLENAIIMVHYWPHWPVIPNRGQQGQGIQQDLLLRQEPNCYKASSRPCARTYAWLISKT